MHWVFDNNISFKKRALQLFKKQSIECETYKEYIQFLGVKSENITEIEDIPFLPISFFKNRQIKNKSKKFDLVFESSGTTGNQTSKHYIVDKKFYEYSYEKGFENFYGDISKYRILALLPSYLEQKNSSLVYMFDKLISKSCYEQSGFFLNNFNELSNVLKEDKPTILIGVSYALLDLIDYSSFKLSNTIIMETGGMKGRRKEMIKSELHKILSKGFGVSKIHSEYGMTELLSQAYSKGDGIFVTQDWMKILLRDPYDPLKIINTQNKTGAINIIDLANINSCAFIATDDLGKIYDDQKFEIIGRIDQADMRGCNLLYDDN